MRQIAREVLLYALIGALVFGCVSFLVRPQTADGQAMVAAGTVQSHVVHDPIVMASVGSIIFAIFAFVHQYGWW